MKQVTRIFLLITLTWLIAACGGGGSLQREDAPTNPNSPDPTTPSAPLVTMTTALTNGAGETASRVTEGTPLTLAVTLTTAAGAAINGELVTFVFNQEGLATFSNDTGTALTNSEGVAQITLFVGSLSGSGAVTASVQEGPSQSVGFESAGAQQQVPFTLDLFANSTQLASSGSEQIELIAVVKNEQNILLADIPISFAADQDASLTVVSSVSGSDGTARALLTTSNNPENRTITITSTSGPLTRTININVVGTEVNINGASSIILNDSAPITFVLSDSDGNGIAGQAIELTADNGILENSSPITNANGQVSVNFTATASGMSTISASALNTSSSFTVTVQQDDFSFTALPTEGLALNQDQELVLRWFRNGQPFVNGSVSVTTSRGSISVGANPVNVALTDAEGFATVNINSAFAGPASISAVGTDGSGNEVTARTNLEFVANTVDSVFVDATPDIIGPEGQTATITAVVRDADGNLVKGKAVNFRLFADSTGGSVSPNTALTDSNGIASTVYRSSAVSAIDGVTIEAESDGVRSLTSLTVGDRAFDISIGTGNEIASPDQSSYLKEFAVFVTDAAGRPINDAALTANASPPAQDAYEKGQWVWFESSRIYGRVGETISIDPLLFSPITSCDSEDGNGNGRLDLPTEDTNGDGQLTPGNVASVSFKGGVARTDANGQATIEVRYAKQFGGWVNILLTVNGQTAGTESSETQLYKLGVAADDLTEESSPPPSNPFGVSTDCSSTR